jgi:hypothetical protein
LLTIIPEKNNEEAKNKAYAIASEFLSALSWENNSRVTIHPPGGARVRENYQLKQAKSCIFDLPRIPTGGCLAVGYDVCRIPAIETEEQRNALILFREAYSSNNEYLSFLFFWQILEIGRNDPIGWVDKAYRTNRDKMRLSEEDITRLPLTKKNLGYYFHDDCRNAIAHIFKRPIEKVRLKLDTPADSTRIMHSTWVVKEFARFYIVDKLKLTKRMYLLRKHGKGFPIFIGEEDAKRFRGTPAYKKPPFGQIRKKSWH